MGPIIITNEKWIENMKEPINNNPNEREEMSTWKRFSEHTPERDQLILVSSDGTRDSEGRSIDKGVYLGLYLKTTPRDLYRSKYGKPEYYIALRAHEYAEAEVAWFTHWMPAPTL